MLTTVDLVKQELRQVKENLTAGGDEAIDDAFILRKVVEIDAQIEADPQLRRQFTPVIATRYYDPVHMGNGGLIDSSEVLWLSRDLFSISALTLNGVGADLDNVLLLPRDDVSKTRIRLLTGESWPYGADPYQGAIAIAGTWGYHEQPSRAWVNSQDTVKTTLSSSGTTLSVNDADGADQYGTTPRFSPGQLLKIDDELLTVTNVIAESTNTLAVLRAQRGSTAAAHSATTAIYSFHPAQVAQQYATRAAAFLYRRRGEFVTTQTTGLSEVRWPTLQTLPEYQALLNLRTTGRVSA